MSGPSGVQDTVLALLGEAFGALTAPELAEQSGLALKPIQDCLWRLRQDGEVAFELGSDGLPTKPRRYLLGEAKEMAEVARVARVAKTLSPGPSPEGRGEEEASAGVLMAAAGVSEVAEALADHRGLEAAADDMPSILDNLELAVSQAEDELQRYVDALEDGGLMDRLRLVDRLREAMEFAQRMEARP